MMTRLEKIWWYFVPWIEVSVKWPSGPIGVGYDDARWYDVGAARVQIHSADPNDHYRPFMEQYVGRQGPDWQWYMANNDAAENRLTIRMRRKYAINATHISMMWN